MQHEDKPHQNILKETLTTVQTLLGPAYQEITLERVVLGLFFTGVKLSNGAGGLSATPIKMIPEAVCCPSSSRAMPDSGRLRGKKVSKIVDDVFSSNPLNKAIAIAALNALSDACRLAGHYAAYDFVVDADPIDFMEFTPDSYTIVIGALLPYLRTLKKGNFPYGILELDPRTLREEEIPYYIPPEAAGEAISRADNLLITGTTLINDTLEGILEKRKETAKVVVLGPTASLYPGAFFSRGVSYLGGITATHPDALLDIISEGGSGYHFYGKCAEKVVVKQRLVETAAV